jgi:hypothetical protein
MRVGDVEGWVLTGWQGWREEEEERGREAGRDGEERRGREAKRVCVFYSHWQSSNYGIARAQLIVHATLSYIQRGHTQRSSSLIPAMTCPPSVSLFNWQRRGDTRRRQREGHQEG